MTPRQVQVELARIRRAADEAVERLQERVRAENVGPFCERYGLRFTSGMGTHSFDNPKTGRRYWPEELPKSLQAMLESDDVTSRNAIGDCMRGYIPESIKGYL